MNSKTAVAAIEKAGVLLVFPMDNRKEPASLWSAFFPRSKMRWEWDESGDNRVAKLWQLKGDLSTTRKVVYTKWYRGRATYLSREVFTAMLRVLNPEVEVTDALRGTLSEDARRILSILESESPLSTKELKRMSGLQGRANERLYEKALRELWERLLIVAFGEVDDGAFPSIAVGSSRVLFEDLWTKAFRMKRIDAKKCVEKILPENNPFYRHYRKLEKQTKAIPSVQTQPDLVESKSQPQVARVIRFEDL